MKHCKKAFTLIELLVVICIIAILASMLLPALQSARDSASTASCVSNLGQLAKAAQMYITSYNDFIPALTVTPAKDTYTSYSGSCSWPDALLYATGQTNKETFYKNLLCDADISTEDPQPGSKKSYSLNNLAHAVHPVIGLTLGKDGKATEKTGVGCISGNKSTAVFAAASLILIGENVSPGNDLTSADFGKNTTKLYDCPGTASAPHQQVTMCLPTSKNTSSSSSVSRPASRLSSHKASAGELYLDGHVKHLPPQKTMPLKEDGSTPNASFVISGKDSFSPSNDKEKVTQGWGEWTDCPKRKKGESCSGAPENNCHKK